MIRSFGQVSFAFVLLVSLACDQRIQMRETPMPADGGDDGPKPPDMSFVLDRDGSSSTTPDAPLDVGGSTGCTNDLCAPVDMRQGPICGNSQIEEGETCDDGNARPGDGCSGLCRLEPNFVCPTPGMPCQSTIVCGDSKIEGSEACDDGNAMANDGCSATCQVEMGYACTRPGMPCTLVPTARCGDGMVNAGETCDDGGMVGNDGCSATCQLEIGWSCPMPGKACVRDEYCGDGRLNGAEECDDGNTFPGDGCTGLCRREPNFECKMPGKPCTSTIICGDGKVVGDEACDDGNTMSNDGCGGDCKRVEPGYTCPNNAGTGGRCTMLPMDVCGDSRITYGEFCDDGNMNNMDGCSSTCRVEPGYSCPGAGMTCQLVEWCGNGKLSVATGEQCDDGNKVGNDGCSALCQIEANHVCPQPGQLCQSTIVCGDRKVTGTETCDDGNLAPGDGCGATCQTENGWTCPAGAACRPTRCGDGLRVGTETCDDGNANNGDGCSSTCRIEVPGPKEADGWNCPTPGQMCVRTVCGNGVREGSEQCDDMDNDTGDTCSPFCRNEPVCPPGGGACATSCGDGLLLPVDKAAGQECDDGNTLSGDGCSSTCKIEPGYRCTDMLVTQDPLILPVIYRDFKAHDQTDGHADFQRYQGDGETGIVMSMLGADGKPVHVAENKNHTTNNDTPTTPDWFSYWYRDTQYSKTIRDTLTFTRLQTGEWQFNDSTFFPIDGKGWGNYNANNFHFTSEVRYWFEYKGGERLDFTGDDDVWVFINKRLAVDIGGLHPAKTGSVILHANNGTGQVCDLITTDCNARRTVDLGLQVGSVYEIVVFQAERRTSSSNYRLTLSNFTGTRSSCATFCGDGIVAGAEICDLGPGMNTGAYGTCNPDCTLPARCGDGMKQAQEDCDDGANVSTYGGSARVCAPGCKWAPYCGDGMVDSANGEACDQATDNGKGYGYCSATCQLGPRCGDGAVSDGEECDDGANNGTPASPCQTTCKKKCGNGTIEAPEECDNGTVNNTGGYGKCTPMCSWGPRCGDGIKNGTEACDDGKNDGSYGNCAPMCVLGPRCGDGMVQMAAGEVCDLGINNQAQAYGKDKCTTRCLPAPYCGDKAVDLAFGEKCDDGVNSGQPGSCKTDCSDKVPLPSCGDGMVQAPEMCDDGTSNGSMASACDGSCRKKCGNGYRDPGEQCDDGKNTGAYGTCNSDCTLAGYCGDGMKNGPEQCDLGTANDAAAYGMGKCTSLCTSAPYCGDGRIQTNFGEVCDSTPNCTAMCKPVIIQ